MKQLTDLLIMIFRKKWLICFIFTGILGANIFPGIPGNLSAKVHPFISLGAGQWGGGREMIKSPFYMAQGGVEMPHFGVSFAVGYYDQYNRAQTLNEGRLTLIPLLLNGYFRIPITKRLKFKAGGGVGYIMAEHTLDDRTLQTQDLYAYKIKNEIKSGIGTQAIGGMEYALTKNCVIGVDIIYIFFKTRSRMSAEFWSGKYLINNVYENEVDFSGMIGLGQVKYKW